MMAMVLLVAPRVAMAQDVLFYNGDDAGSPRAFQTSQAWDGNPEIHALSYDNFLVSGASWSVTGLFGTLYSETPFTSLYWEIRTGVSEGVGGTLIGGGVAAATTTALTSGSFALAPDLVVSYTTWDTHVDISDAHLVLDPGMYWLALAPLQPAFAYHGSVYIRYAGLVEARGTHGVNPVLDQTTYHGSSYIKNVLTEADYSVGVEGSTVPEPATMTLLATGMLGLASMRRRRR